MPSPSLFAYNRIEDLWASVLSPWIRQQNARAWSDNRPTAFVLPNNTWVDAVKRLCLEKKTDTFAIQWWTQGQLRAHLLSHYLPQSQLALREDMQFLMSHAVQPNNAQPQEILPDPDPFLRLYDQIASAGWSAEAFEDPFWHGIANRFEDLLDKSHLLSTWQADKILAQRAGQKPQPPLASLLILGFGPYNGSSLLLLKTAVAMADHSTICLDISDEDNPFQHAFVGAWEQAYGECEFVLNPDYPPLPFQPLADNFANKQAPLSASSNPSPIYHIANDLSEEAEAIFHRALSFVAEGTCVGIVFVRANALYREVSLRLGKANLPHYDALGFWGQQSLPFRWFQSWVNLQNELCLSQLLPFLEYCRELSILPVEELATIQKCLKYTYETVWTDDLVVLMAYLKNAKTTSNSDQNTTQEETTLSFLEKWIIPSEPKTMREWVQSVLMLLQAANLDLEWDERQERLQASIEGLMSAEPSPLKKEKALAWMTQVLRKAGRMRTALGNHIQAPLVLMSPEDVATRSWSHLILAGLNDGNWPQPIDFSPALPEKRIQALNEQVLLRGDQGEGHLSLRTGYSLLLTNDATRRRHYDCFYRLLAAPTKGLALTASTTAEDDPNRHLAPSELLQSLYRCDRGQALDEATWSALARQTQKCLASIPKEPQEHLSLELNFPPIEATKKAYKARRDPSQPFGPFEFSFQAPPPDGIPLPCKAWEALLKRPASVWLENILKVAKPSTFTEAPQWALAIGTWVHQWLGSDNPKDGANELSWHSEVTRLSLQCLHQVQTAYEESGRSLPDWWHSAWSQARSCTDRLAKSLESIKDWPYRAVEWSFPQRVEVPIDEQDKLLLSGRIDLLLSNRPIVWGKAQDHSRQANGDDAKLWIIDFKTGGDKLLSPKTLQKGEGVQVALYGLAWQNQGYSRVQMSLLRPDTPLEKEPLEAKQLNEYQELWHGLAKVQRQGCIGQCNPLSDDYTFVGDYPLAMLPVDEEVLTKKWSQSHPLLPLPRMN